MCFKMAYLKELRPGKRENAFYVNENVIGSSSWEEYVATLPKKVEVYSWDEKQKKHVRRFVDTEEFLKE